MPPRRWSVAHVPKPSALLRARRWSTSFQVRALSRTGGEDPAPARASWTVDWALPAVTVKNPPSGSTTSTGKPTSRGWPARSPGIRRRSPSMCSRVLMPWVCLYRRLTATASAGEWSVPAAQALPNGASTAQAEQSGQRRQPRRERGDNLRGQCPAVCGPAGRRDHIERLTCVVDDLVVHGYDVDGYDYPRYPRRPPLRRLPRHVDHHDVPNQPAPPGTDDFNRPDGGLGAGLAAMGDGGLSIASQAVVGRRGRLRGISGLGRATGVISIRGSR